KKKEEVDKFIKQLADCAAKADSGGNVQPQSLDRPTMPTTTTTPTTTTPTTTTTKPNTTTPTTTSTTQKPTTTTTTPTTTSSTTTPTTTSTTPTTTSTTPTTTTATTTTPTTTPTTTAQLENPDEEPEEQEPSVRAQTGTGATMISARAEGGVALLGGKDLKFPAQPVFAVSGGYPLAAGPAVVELGAGISFSPLPYQAMGEQKQGSMIGARVQAVGAYPVAPKLWLRGELGVGVVALGGLEMGNPLTTDGSAKSFTLLSVRAGVAADYEITPNIVATLQPFAFAFSPKGDGIGALREIDVLVGLGYRK
ncbi:MAG TPA: hypothetical protein VMZ53_31645, partial [Kofleriaceae bacterium]|nr:hypothetical protein [Kofleriaceae bacterium]